MQFSLFATSVFVAGKNREWRTSLEGTVLMRPDGHGMRVVLAFLVLCVCVEMRVVLAFLVLCVCRKRSVHVFHAHITTRYCLLDLVYFC